MQRLTGNRDEPEKLLYDIDGRSRLCFNGSARTPGAGRAKQPVYKHLVDSSHSSWGTNRKLFRSVSHLLRTKPIRSRATPTTVDRAIVIIALAKIRIDRVVPPTRRAFNLLDTDVGRS